MNDFKLIGRVLKKNLQDKYLLIEEIDNEKNVIPCYFSEIKNIEEGYLCSISATINTIKVVNNGYIEYETKINIDKIKKIGILNSEEEFF